MATKTGGQGGPPRRDPPTDSGRGRAGDDASDRTIAALNAAAAAMEAGAAACEKAGQGIARGLGIDATSASGGSSGPAASTPGGGVVGNRQFASMIGQSVFDALAKAGVVGSATSQAFGGGGGGSAGQVGSGFPVPMSASPLGKAVAALTRATAAMAGQSPGASPAGPTGSSTAPSFVSSATTGPIGSAVSAALVRAIPAMGAAAAGGLGSALGGAAIKSILSRFATPARSPDAGSPFRDIGSILGSAASRFASQGFAGASGLGGLGGPFAGGASPWVRAAAQFKKVADQAHAAGNPTAAGNPLGAFARSAIQKAASFATQNGINPGGGQHWQGVLSRAAIHAANATARRVAGRAYMASGSPGFRAAFGSQASNAAQSIASQFQAYTAGRAFQTSLHTGAYAAFAKIFGAGGSGAVGNAAQAAGWTRVGGLVAGGVARGLSAGSLAVAPIAGLLNVTAQLARQAEAWTQERAHLAGYSPLAARAYGRLEFGDHDRNYRLAGMTEKTLAAMADAVNALRDSELPRNVLAQNLQNAAGSFGAGFWSQINRDLAPAFEAVNGGLFGKGGLVDFDPSVAGAGLVGALKGLGKALVDPRNVLDPGRIPGIVQEEADRAAREQQDRLNAPGLPQPWGPAFNNFLNKAPLIPFVPVPRIN